MAVAIQHNIQSISYFKRQSNQMKGRFLKKKIHRKVSFSNFFFVYVEKQISIDEKRKSFSKIKSEAIGRRHASNMLLSGMKNIFEEWFLFHFIWKDYFFVWYCRKVEETIEKCRNWFVIMWYVNENYDRRNSGLSH